VTLAAAGAMLAVLLGCTGLAVDVAHGYVVRGMLQHAVDDGARTAQRWSTQVDDPGVDPAAVQRQAVAAALDTVRRDLTAEGLAGATVIDTRMAGPQLNIAARASIPTWFISVIGVTSWTPSASSTVALWMPEPIAPAAPPPGAGMPAPAFPPTAGTPPSLTLSEGAPGAGGTQTGAGPEPDISNGSSGAPGGTAEPPGGAPEPSGPGPEPMGGDIEEGF
jgi:hypothetical protein